MKEVVIIGAGGHGKVVADIIIKSNDIVKGFLDDNYEKDTFIGYPVLGKINDYYKYKDCEFIVSIGDATIREKIVNKMNDVKWYIGIHPSAVISNIGVDIGFGTVIMANAVINSGSTIGEHCIINTGAIVEHDNQINDYVHISVGAKLAGNVYIGKKTWIGIGAIVNNNTRVCERCLIGAGGVVVKNIEEIGVYVGMPVRKMY